MIQKVLYVSDHFFFFLLHKSIEGSLPILIFLLLYPTLLSPYTPPRSQLSQMRTATKYTLLVLSLSAALITAAPIESVIDANELIEAQQRQQEQQTPFAFLEQEGTSFEALATPPLSSFLIEFNLPPAGVNRHERMRMEETGEFQGFTANRHTSVAMQHQNFQDFMIDQLKVDFAVRHEFFDLMNGISIDLQGVPPHKLPQILEQIRDIPDVVKVSPLVSPCPSFTAENSCSGKRAVTNTHEESLYTFADRLQ